MHERPIFTGRRFIVNEKSKASMWGVDTQMTNVNHILHI
jgi:hypothetical protein